MLQRPHQFQGRDGIGSRLFQWSVQIWTSGEICRTAKHYVPQMMSSGRQSEKSIRRREPIPVDIGRAAGYTLVMRKKPWCHMITILSLPSFRLLCKQVTNSFCVRLNLPPVRLMICLVAVNIIVNAKIFFWSRRGATIPSSSVYPKSCFKKKCVWTKKDVKTESKSNDII